ncbi:MAG TPA: hypothetical protein VJK51_02400 [Candidatus Nanoarchaeia archaeon]|nr:hypothetical protein [Candidatus Nanoarchaeia archaeon]
METIFVRNITEIKKAIPEWKKKATIKITLEGNKATIEGTPVEELETQQMLDAISFGFSAKKALILKEPDMQFKKLHIKTYNPRRTLESIKSRVIGTFGRTKNTIEEISNTDIVIGEAEVGIIGHAENINEAETALINVIRGSKQANAYSFLERMNREKKKQPDDLGIIDPKAKKD